MIIENEIQADLIGLEDKDPWEVLDCEELDCPDGPELVCAQELDPDEGDRPEEDELDEPEPDEDDTDMLELWGLAAFKLLSQDKNKSLGLREDCWGSVICVLVVEACIFVGLFNDIWPFGVWVLTEGELVLVEMVVDAEITQFPLTSR